VIDEIDLPNFIVSQRTMSTVHPPTLSELASTISQHVDALTCTLAKHKLPQPTLDKDGPPTFPGLEEIPELAVARNAVLDAAKELITLVQGPTESLTMSALSVGPCPIYQRASIYSVANN
jgi:hypothetical protein